MNRISNFLTIFFVIGLFVVGLNRAIAAPPVDFADVAEPLMPSVVNISTSQLVEAGRLPRGVPPGLEDFFEEFLPRNRAPENDDGDQKRKVSSLGSGFVISADGLIVTNNHVIEAADEITVKFTNGDEYEAKLLGRDPKTDIALLKIETGKTLPFVKFGDSNKARIGEWVLAIGNPFGLGGSVSAGIISAINRDIRSGPYDSFIQTDAAINRGNSGGPLFNMNGEVIGINSAIISPTGGSVGIGFSIPADLAQSVIAQLEEFGETRRSWIGVMIQPVTNDLVESLGLKKAQGALVSSVEADGPAEKAGVKRGDVILRFDEKEVPMMRDLPRIVAETPIHKTVKIVVMREGKPKTLTIKTTRMKEDVSRISKEKKTNGETIEFAGMSLKELDGQTRRQIGLDEGASGALISKVETGSPADDSGVRRGEVIIEIGHEEVDSLDQALTRLEAAKAQQQKSVLVLLLSPAGQRYVALQLDED